MRRSPVVLVCVLVVGCGQTDRLSAPPGLTLPEGDRVVRVQPGDCVESCLVVDERYEAVVTVRGRERDDEQVGRELAVSLARSGWTEAEPPAGRYTAGQVTYPYRFTRSDGADRSYLELLPVLPGEYGLTYDRDGDTVAEAD